MSSTDLVECAARIKCCVPNQAFTIPMALWCAGADSSRAFNAYTQDRTKRATEAILSEIACVDDIENQKERAKILVCCAKRVPRSIHKYPLVPRPNQLCQQIPNLNGIKDIQASKSVTDYCRLVGFNEKLLDTKTNSKPEYMSIYNFEKNLKKQNSSIEPIFSTSVRYSRRQITIPDSELSLERRASKTHNGPVSSIVINHDEDLSVLTSPANSSLRTSMDTSNGSPPPSAVATTCTSLGTEPVSQAGSFAFRSAITESVSRNTSKNAHKARADDEAWRQCEESAYILGTQVYDMSLNGKLPLEKFKNSADAVAHFINIGFGLDIISGRQIANQVRNGNVGKPPSKKGRKKILSEDDIKDLASLVFTANSIDQVNSTPNRLRKKELTSLVGKIVNTKRDEDGDMEINDNSLYRHIQKVLDTKCTIDFTDTRELLRLKWLTYEQQKKHYVNWEMFMIKFGFGRAPIDDAERLREGHVVFFNHMLRRMLHIDEMGFSFDGSKNGIGGRHAAIYTNPNLPNPGEAIAKSSEKISILFGATYDGQAIPPLIVFPSSAKNPKFDGQMVQLLHQIEGHFGYNEKKGDSIAS